MTRPERGEQISLQDAWIERIEVLDKSWIVVTFSNGLAARIEAAMVKQLTLSSASEFARWDPEP